MKQQTLSEAWDDYEAHVQSMGLAPASLAGYRSNVRALLREHGDRKLALINDKHVSAFMLDAAKTRNANSMGTTHSTLSAFFNYCVGTGRLKPQQNPMFGRKRPKAQERDRLKIPVDKWPLLLALAEGQSARDRMIVALGLYSLLRDQEMARLRIRDVDLNGGHITAIITKSRKVCEVSITADLDHELRRWYKAYQRAVGPLQPDMLLIPRLRGARVRNESTGKYVKGRFAGTPGEYMPYGHIKKMSYVITPLIEKMGYPVKDENGISLREGAHTLRRSGARAYYDYLVSQNRADALRIVQNMMNHSSTLMTQHYIGLHEDTVTRDELLRGRSIFGFHEIAMIGAGHGETARNLHVG